MLVLKTTLGFLKAGASNTGFLFATGVASPTSIPMHRQGCQPLLTDPFQSIGFPVILGPKYEVLDLE